MDTLEDALADEILAECARQRYTATEMQRRTGIKSRSWQNYLVQRSRPIPLRAVYDIADVLGLSGSELMKRAERRAAQQRTHAARAEAALRRATPEAQRRARKIARELRPQSEDDDPDGRTGGPRINRSATTAS